MIEEITIRDLGVITEASLPLGKGLTVVTGETGAGKTMVVTALGLLLGGRADAAMVRQGARAASVEASVLLPKTAQALWRADEAGAQWEEHDDGDTFELLMARTVSAQGRGRAFLGGRAIPVAVMGEVGKDVVTIHGQNGQLRLRQTSAQREALDAFAVTRDSTARVGHVVREYRACYERWVKTRERLRAYSEEDHDLQELSEALTDIDAVDPQPGEDHKLKNESVKLSAIESLRWEVGQAQEALANESFGEKPDAISLVETAHSALERIAQSEVMLESCRQRLAEVRYTLNDITSELARYWSSLNLDAQGRLAEVEQRRAELNRLLRTYGKEDVDAVLAWAEEARNRVAALTLAASSYEAWEQECRDCRARLDELAQELSDIRRQAAVQLADEVAVELAALAMPQARLRVDFQRTEPGIHGIDEIAFAFQAHRDGGFRPIGKGASGGELSRIMLALEVVLADEHSPATLVFDEVDAGVGGKAAIEIGRRLSLLAAQVQVIVVTHLPQVAAFGQHHIRVLKNSEEGFTASDVELLDDDGRVTELARMLAGRDDSASARAHARELLDHTRSAEE